jgi:hypothetical protein
MKIEAVAKPPQSIFIFSLGRLESNGRHEV